MKLTDKKALITGGTAASALPLPASSLQRALKSRLPAGISRRWMMRSPNWGPMHAAIAPTLPWRTTASGSSRISPGILASWTSSSPMPELAVGRRQRNGRSSV